VSLLVDGVLLMDNGGRLDFFLEPSSRDAFPIRSEGYLSLPPERCASVFARRFGDDGAIRLVFRFVLTGSEMAIAVGVPPDAVEEARRFVARLERIYGIGEVSWLPPEPEAEPEPEPEAEPERPAPAPGPGPGDRQDWVSAPVSPETRELYDAVMARLTGTET
jgi:hypothetical protein